MNELSKVDRILEAWLQFIRIKTHSEAQVPEKDTVHQGVSLYQNNVLIDEAMFLKRQKTYNLDKRTARGQTNNPEPWLLSFPQIYTVEKGRTYFCPLFSLDISSILSGEHQLEGWDISQLPMTEAGENLMTFSQIEEEKLCKLVTKEGLHRFLRTTFEISFDSFEDWMQQVPSSGYEIEREPYLFSSRGGGYSKNLQTDLKSIRQCKKKHWIKADHPAYQYLFGKPSTATNPDTYYLGAFPTNPPTDSQLVVLKHLKAESMTAVQGPPGSGKTTLILHAIAQQVVSRAIRIIEGQPDASNLTLVTSSNNRAVDNVIEKLQDFECPSPHLPVPFLYLEGGKKDKIGKAGGAAEQLDKAKEYLSTHSYSEKVSKSCTSEIKKITSAIAAKAAKYERVKQQRQQDTKKRQQLAKEISSLQQSLAHAKQTYAQLQRREGQIAAYDQLPKQAYECIHIQFRKAQSQLPGKLPRWIQWFCWLIGRTEPQIISKTLTDQCQQAIQSTWETRFRIEIPSNKSELYEQSQRVDEILTAIQELQTVRADLKGRVAQGDELRTAIRQKQENLKAIDQKLLLKTDDFYQTFHVTYQEQHKALFYLSQQFLLQKALQQKEVVLKSLTAYAKLIGTSGTTDTNKNMDRMATALDEHIKALSLVFPVVTSSLLSVRNMLPWTNSCIDLAIIDEAGMILLHNSFPALVKTQKALIVGDPLQIEPIVSISPQTLQKYKQDSFLSKGLTQDDYYLYSPSELETATTYHRAANANAYGKLGSEIKLKEHFRCQQSIIDYCSGIANYDLVCKTAPSGSLLGTEKGKKDGKNMVAYHVEGKIRDQVNVAEVEAVYDIFTYLVKERGYSVKDIGVVSPFSAHIRAIKHRLRQRYRDIEEDAIGTVHTFQGSEKLVMIFSTRVCQQQHASLQWINKRPNMLNVAVSRAKELFILVGNLSYLKSRGYTRRLIEHTNEHGVVLEYKTEEEVSLQYGSGSGEFVIQNCDHLEAFASVLKDVKSELSLAVPAIGGRSARQFIQDIQPILERGVKVTVLYGTPGQKSQGRKANEEQRLKALFDKYDNARLIRVEGMGTNQRLLLCDDQFAIAGSWNWLSHMYAEACARQAITAGVQIRKETSFRLSSANAIRQIREDIQTMR